MQTFGKGSYGVKRSHRSGVTILNRCETTKERDGIFRQVTNKNYSPEDPVVSVEKI